MQTLNPTNQLDSYFYEWLSQQLSPEQLEQISADQDCRCLDGQTSLGLAVAASAEHPDRLLQAAISLCVRFSPFKTNEEVIRTLTEMAATRAVVSHGGKDQG